MGNWTVLNYDHLPLKGLNIFPNLALFLKLSFDLVEVIVFALVLEALASLQKWFCKHIGFSINNHLKNTNGQEISHNVFPCESRNTQNDSSIQPNGLRARGRSDLLLLGGTLLGNTGGGRACSPPGMHAAQPGPLGLATWDYIMQQASSSNLTLCDFFLYILHWRWNNQVRPRALFHAQGKIPIKG